MTPSPEDDDPLDPSLLVCVPHDNKTPGGYLPVSVVTALYAQIDALKVELAAARLQIASK